MSQKPWEHGTLRVADSGRSLAHADGSPFFYLADTCWELAHRLNLEEATKLMKTRARQGFNVLHVVALAELDGIRTPNFYGDRPLIDEDPLRPDEAGGYWRYLDELFDVAEANGLYLALLPTWGDKVSRAWGAGPVIFTDETARAFGEWIGSRYGHRPNLIWVNGGDRDPLGYESVWKALAEGFQSRQSVSHLTTFHPQGEQSSAMSFHEADWLDFNMLQTGHGSLSLDHVYRMTSAAYQRVPVKPVLDGEPRYENHPIGFNARNGYFDAGDVRQATYIGLFLGGCGFTYGCHAIWQFASQRHEPLNNPIANWEYSLELPGANQMARVRDILFELGFPNASPAGQVVADNQPYPSLKTEDGVAIYSHDGGTIRTLAAYEHGKWLDTRKSESMPATSENAREWKPPASGSRVNDWVLRLRF